MSRRRGGDPERVGDILARFLKEAKSRESRVPADLDAIWREAAGEVAARHSRVASFRRGVLTVEVFSAALHQELEVYRREDLLKALQARFPGGIDRISFRLA